MERMERVVRMPDSIWEGFEKSVDEHDPRETIAFLMARKVQGDDRTVYVVSEMIAPSDNEAPRTPTSVHPSDGFSQALWERIRSMKQRIDLHVIIIHSHPFSSGHVRLSSIDRKSLEDDYRIYRETFDGEVDLVHIVFDRNLQAFDAICIERDCPHPIDLIVAYGRKLQLLTREPLHQNSEPDQLYERAFLVPEFDRETFANLRVVLVGAGGTGSLTATWLAMQGVSENSKTVIVDPDIIEESNRQRIPYARSSTIGKSKALVAQKYIEALRPNRTVEAIHADCFDSQAQQEIACSDITILCTDSELSRSFINQFASNFQIPIIDIASQIVVEEVDGKILSTSFGHSRLFIPGLTACLACTAGFHQGWLNAEYARRTMEPGEEELLLQAGYVENLTDIDLPQPSVYSLNAAVTNTGLLSLQWYVCRGIDPQKNMFRFLADSMSTRVSQSTPDPTCPYCGEEAPIGCCEFPDIDQMLGGTTDLDTVPVPDLATMEQKGVRVNMENEDSSEVPTDPIPPKKKNKLRAIFDILTSGKTQN